MRLEHAHPGAESVVKTVAPRFDPKHRPDDRKVEKENDVGHVAIGKGNSDDRGAAGDGPIRRDVESLPLDHDSAELAPVKMRHRIDVARIVQAALQRDRGFLVGDVVPVFCCHGFYVNRISDQ